MGAVFNFSRIHLPPSTLWWGGASLAPSRRSPAPPASVPPRRAAAAVRRCTPVCSPICREPASRRLPSGEAGLPPRRPGGALRRRLLCHPGEALLHQLPCRHSEAMRRWRPPPPISAMSLGTTGMLYSHGQNWHYTGAQMKVHTVHPYIAALSLAWFIQVEMRFLSAICLFLISHV